MNHEQFHALRGTRLSEIQKLKEKYLQEASETEDISKKLDKLNSAAFLEEKEHWLKNFEGLAERYDKKDVYKAILSISLQSPDDTWSGRGNDFRRKMNDAKREALKEISDWVEFYC